MKPPICQSVVKDGNIPHPLDISPPCPWPGPSAPSRAPRQTLWYCPWSLEAHPLQWMFQQNVSSIPRNWWQVLDDVISPRDLGIDPGFAYSCHVQQGQGIPEFGRWKSLKTRRKKKKTISGGWTWWNLHFHHFSILLAYLDSDENIYLLKKKRTGFYRLNTPIFMSVAHLLSPPHPPSCATRCAAPPPSEPRCDDSSDGFTIPFSLAGKGM